MRRPTWRLLALLLLVGFAFQGTRGIWEPDEGRYTAAGLNMLETGDWLVPTLDRDRPHLTKPPITYWALASSIGLLGRNECALRTPAALAFVGTGLLLFGLGRRLCPRKPWLPAVLWALSLAPVMAANIVSTDALLVFFETLAMYAFVEAYSRQGAERRRWTVAMWVAWGLAFMTKGPPALLPLLAMVAFLAIHDRSRLRSFFPPLGLLAFAVVAFTWFGLIVWQEPERMRYFLGYEVYDRVFTGVHKRNAEWYGAFEVYLPVLLVGALPWWVLALVAAGGPSAAWRRVRDGVRGRDRELLLLLYWFLVPLAVFFVAQSRLYLYVVPLFVPLLLLVARTLASWPWLNDRRLAWIGAATAAVVLVLKGSLAYWPHDRDARAMSRAITAAVDVRRYDEIVFVSMPAFYGLSFYLDVPVDSVLFRRETGEFSQYVSPESICPELAERERTLFVFKAKRTDTFRASAAKCGYQAVPVGAFHGDGNELQMYVARRGAVTEQAAAPGRQKR